MASSEVLKERVIPYDDTVPYNEQLLKLVKTQLNITWDDDDTNGKLINMIDDAEVALNHQLGVADMDYTAPGEARRLFLNYMLYAWNDSLEEFDHAYISEIIKLRNKYAVLKRKQNDEQEEIHDV